MKLRYLCFVELDNIRCEEKIYNELKNNITIEETQCVSSMLNNLASRNKSIQKTIRKSVLTFIAIRRFKKGLLNVPLEIIIIIAKYLYSTRGDIVWKI